MTSVDATRPVTGGVDTHLDVNVAAALDPIGGLLGTALLSSVGGPTRNLTPRPLEADSGWSELWQVA